MQIPLVNTEKQTNYVQKLSVKECPTLEFYKLLTGSKVRAKLNDKMFDVLEEKTTI